MNGLDLANIIGSVLIIAPVGACAWLLTIPVQVTNSLLIPRCANEV
jgi:hypothetical protein